MMPEPKTQLALLQQLAELNANLSALKHSYKRLDERSEKVEHYLTGGNNPEDGIIIKLDRLREDAKRKERWIKAGIGAAVASIFSFIGILIKGVIK